MRSIFVAFAAGAVLLVGCPKTTEPPPPPEPDPNFGDACRDAEECFGGLTCLPDFPSGYCTRICDEEPCEEGAICVSDFGVDLCLAECASDGDCRGRYECWRGTCRPPCDSDSICGDGATCVDGSCEGAECTRDRDCADGEECIDGSCEMMMEVDAGPPGCDPGECPSGECLPPSVGDACVVACEERSDCTGDSVCSPVRIDDDGDDRFDRAIASCVPANPAGNFLAGRCSQASETSQCESRSCLGNQCTEICNDDDDCLLGMSCVSERFNGTMLQTCSYEARTETIEDLSLGRIMVGAGAPTTRINFGIPDDAVSVALVADYVSGDRELDLSFVNVWDSRNDRIFDVNEIFMLRDPDIRWIPSNTHESITMLVPNTTDDRYTFRRGRFGVTLTGLINAPGDSRSVVVDFRARIKRAPRGDVTSGTLDLNIHLVSGIGLDASSAARDSRIAAALEKLSANMARADINIGDVRFFDVAGSGLSVIDTAEGEDSELSQLFRLSAPRTNNALDIFLVRSIDRDRDGGGITLGIAGGIPGPAGSHGNGHSGVVVAIDSTVVGGGGATIGQIMTHEIGHYLGLFHSTEAVRACRDGEEPSAANPCSPFGGGDVLTDTTRGDDRNLMYFQLTTFGGSTFNERISAGQAFVMLRNPLIE